MFLAVVHVLHPVLLRVQRRALALATQVAVPLAIVAVAALAISSATAI